MDIRNFFKRTPKRGKGAKDGESSKETSKKRKSNMEEPPKKKRRLSEKKEDDIEIADPKIENQGTTKEKNEGKEKIEEIKKEDNVEEVEVETKVEESETTTDGPDEIQPNEMRSADAFYAKWHKKKDKFKGSKYDPIKDAGWKKTDKNVPYAALSKMFDEVGANSARLVKIELVCNFLRSVIALHPQDLPYVVYLCANKIAAPYEGIELGVGDSVIYRALKSSTGRKLSEMKAEMARVGDLGTVAVNSRNKQSLLFKPKALTVKQVYQDLRKVAAIKGGKSGKKKEGIINKLYVAAVGVEAKYITRHLLGKSMKLGLAEQTVFASLAKACAFTPPALTKPLLDLSKKMDEESFDALYKDYDARLKQVFSELPNYDVVISALAKHGFPSLHSRCHLTPGVPVKAMLAKPTKGVEEILERFSDCKFTLEYKYDGERAQIHLLEDGSVRIFSRNAEDNTGKYPDLVEAIPSFIKEGTTSFIIDCEVVAYDREKGKILPFQDLSHRKRKDVKEVSIQVCLYCFDLLYINGRSLLREHLGVRRDLLHSSFIKKDGTFHFADYKDSSDPEEIQAFLDLAVEQSCEGLMVKALDGNATYEPAKRSLNWLKCKKDYLDGCGDTLDLVVMGAFHGTGKRTGFYGSYLVGCYSEEDDQYQTTCKVGTGFKDEDLKVLTDALKKVVAPKKPMEFEVNTSAFDCDVWFEPSMVWEVKCADLQVSPVHTAGVGKAHPSKGIGLRFPRFLRIRDDKKPEQATNADQVHKFYTSQAVVQSNQDADMDDFEDF